MTQIASAATRSAIATLAGFVLFMAASFVLYPASYDHKVDAVLRALPSAVVLTITAIVWLALSTWLWLEPRLPVRQPSRTARITWAALATLLAAAGIVVLNAIVSQAFGKLWFGFSWRYELRIFEAALFAVTMVRIALPLVPRFARMLPHIS